MGDNDTFGKKEKDKNEVIQEDSKEGDESFESLKKSESIGSKSNPDSVGSKGLSASFGRFK